MTHRVSESASRPSGFCCAYHLGTVDYGDSYRLQKGLQQARSECLIGDTILLLDHPPVITLGRRGDNGNVLVPEAFLHEQGIEVFNTDRGGDVTFHNPGQIVAYFIVNIDSLGKSIHQYVRSLEEIVIQALADFQIEGERDEKHPGVWVGDKKVCAIGLQVSRGVSAHGFALNVNNDLAIASYIHPCGLSDRGVTSLFELLSRKVDIDTVIATLLQKAGKNPGRNNRFLRSSRPTGTNREGGFPMTLNHPRIPPWLNAAVPVGADEKLREMRRLLAIHRLNSVCQSARCPNMARCFSKRTVTFMILGDVCTRSCSFCGVTTGMPRTPDPGEAAPHRGGSGFFATPACGHHIGDTGRPRRWWRRPFCQGGRGIAGEKSPHGPGALDPRFPGVPHGPPGGRGFEAGHHRSQHRNRAEDFQAGKERGKF